MNLSQIDHIVYCVPDLKAAILDLTAKLGVSPLVGGRHLTKGTKNALLRIGEKTYLEILAIDSANPSFNGSHWMGIDYIDSPCITRWCLASQDLNSSSKTLKSINPKLGEIEIGSRLTMDEKLLSWQMTLPIARPKIDLLPFYIDWSKSEMHPCANLPFVCELQSITLHTAEINRLHSILNPTELTPSIIKSSQEKIMLEIKSPNGIIQLS